MPWAAAALPYIAAAATVAGTAVSAVGAIQQGNAANAANQYNAQVQADRANQSLQASASQAQTTAQQTAEKMGQAQAAYGGAGIDSSQGSPLDMMSSLASKGEMNRQLNLYQGKVNASADVDQSTLDTLEGQQAQQAGVMKAGASLLTGAATSANNLTKLATN